MPSKKIQEPEQEISPLEEITALKELIAVVVDYYCFKNNDFVDMGESEESYLSQNEDSENSDNIIPEDIDGLIEEAFKNQLKKFT